MQRTQFPTPLSKSPIAIDSLASQPVDWLLTPDEVAKRLSVSRSMVYKLIRTRVLPVVYVGRLPRVGETELATFIGRQREGDR